MAETVLGARARALEDVASAADGFVARGTRGAFAELTSALQTWATVDPSGGPADLATAIDRFHSETSRRESVDAVRATAAELGRQALAALEDSSEAPDSDRRDRRFDRRLVLAGLALLMVATATGVTLVTRSSSPADKGREVEATVEDPSEVSAYLTGKGKLVATFRELSAPLLGLDAQGDLGQARATCTRVASALNVQVDPMKLLEAAEAIPDPALVEIAVNERSARSRVLIACGAQDRRGLVAALRGARAAEELFKVELG